LFDAAEKKLVGETGFAPARACAHEFLRLACIRSTTHRKLVRPGRFARPRAIQSAAVFKTARSTVPRTAANGRGGRIRTGTGHHAQRVLSPPCLRSNHAAINWCGQRESHPHGLSPIGSSGRRVYCSATSGKKTGSGTETCAPLFPIPTGCVAAYALPAKNGRSGRTRTFVAPRGQRVYSRRNCCSATLRKKWGLERDSHPRPSPYEGATLPAAPSSRIGGPPR
jgi:hypothetical protein